MRNSKGQFIKRDITGIKDGSLEYLKRTNKKGGNGQYLWLAQCKCGKKLSIRPFKNKSCGCLRGNKKHGMVGTHFYDTWEGIQRRSKHPTGNGAEIYKNIKCLWNSFEDFRDDMYESYLKHVDNFGTRETTIDRIDNEGNYCKGNCRWATQKEQARNKSNNINITFAGKTMCVSAWAEELEIKRETLQGRLQRSGWSVEKALTIPAVIGRNQHS